MKVISLRKADIEKLFSCSLWKSVRMDEHLVDGHFVVDVSLTEEMLITAMVIGGRITQYDEEHNFSKAGTFTGSYKADVGGLYGTLAAAAYICRNWLKALDSINIRKGADEGDLHIGSKVIDVKNRLEAWHNKLMIPERQWLKRKFDAYVSCNIVKENAETVVRLWGYVTKEDLEKKGKWDDFGHGPTLTMPFIELSDIRELLGKSSTT